VKKSKIWVCKVCNFKQSVIKVGYDAKYNRVDIENVIMLRP
jgi:hypothetical protein